MFIRLTIWGAARAVVGLKTRARHNAAETVNVLEDIVGGSSSGGVAIRTATLNTTKIKGIVILRVENP